jgi:predicted GIY-YIG superfamily endonuclease
MGAIHHHVYVILLDSEVGTLPRVQQDNPGCDPQKPCVYVGMTGLDPVERFKKHKSGRKASRYVQRYGIRLMPELYQELNPLTYAEAVIAEQGLARRLRNEGYTVVGGH